VNCKDERKKQWLGWLSVELAPAIAASTGWKIEQPFAKRVAWQL
jgi:hypothetical protein